MAFAPDIFFSLGFGSRLGIMVIIFVGAFSSIYTILSWCVSKKSCLGLI